jgi:hypothetical protein
MKGSNMIVAALLGAGLAFGAATQADEKEHEEQGISTIIRWEKEGNNYEAVVEKNGKQTGLEMDANGKW